jgi:hypothetical protein
VLRYGAVLYCISVDRYDLVKVTAADEEDKHSVIVRCSQATARTGGLQVSWNLAGTSSIVIAA